MYILLMYAPIMFVMYLSNLSNSIWLWTVLVEPTHNNCERKNGVTAHYVLKF